MEATPTRLWKVRTLRGAEVQQQKSGAKSGWVCLLGLFVALLFFWSLVSSLSALKVGFSNENGAFGVGDIVS